MKLSMIKQMERHARSDPNVISLGQGIPAATAPEAIHSAVIRALRNSNDIDRYSDPLGLPELRKRIARQLQKAGMDYGEDEIMATAGAIEAINATLQTFVTSAKSEVIVPTPTYSAYERAIRCAKGTPIPVLLQEDQDWQLEVADIEAAITPKTAAILLCNPNNPTGSLYDRRTLLALCELAKRHGFLLILDEVYGNMIFDDNELYTPCVDATFRKNIVRIVSFSKDFNLTGWRIGFLHSDREVIEQITPVHDTLVNCAPVVSQYAAMAALDIYQSVVEDNRKSYEERRYIMQQYVDGMPELLTYVPPKGGYFLFPKLLVDTDATAFCYDLLKHAQVIAIPGDDFGRGGTQHIRLCFGRSTEDIHTGMQRLQRYMLGRYEVKTSEPRTLTSVGV